MTTTTNDQIRASTLAAGYGGIEQTATSSQDVSAVLRASVRVSLRRVQGRRRVILTVPTFDAAATYTAIIDGVTEAEATPATQADLWTDLGAALTTSLGSSYTLTAGATSLTVDGPADMVVSWTAAGGTTALRLTVEPVSCRVALLGSVALSRLRSDDLIRQSQGAQPLLLHDGCGGAADYLIDADGLHGKIDVSDVDTLAVEITDAAADDADVCEDVVVVGPISYILPLYGGAL